MSKTNPFAQAEADLNSTDNADSKESANVAGSKNQPNNTNSTDSAPSREDILDALDMEEDELEAASALVGVRESDAVCTSKEGIHLHQLVQEGFGNVFDDFATDWVVVGLDEESVHLKTAGSFEESKRVGYKEFGVGYEAVTAEDGSPVFAY